MAYEIKTTVGWWKPNRTYTQFFSFRYEIQTLLCALLILSSSNGVLCILHEKFTYTNLSVGVFFVFCFRCSVEISSEKRMQNAINLKTLRMSLFRFLIFGKFNKSPFDFTHLHAICQLASTQLLSHTILMENCKFIFT